MDVPNKVVFAIVIVVSVLQLAIRNVAAADYLVGGEKGWTTNVDYRAWAQDKIFQVGDRLVFRYEQGAHNVVGVKRDAFKNCVVPSTSHVLTSGYDIVELTTGGRKWFISGVGDQCSDGQKLAITVFLTAFLPRIPLLPGYQLPPSDAPSPSLTSENAPGWWELFPPTSSAPSLPHAPTPSFDFPWKLFFPPSTAPAPDPSFEFPWKLFFPPSTAPAPAPSFDFPWKLLFPPSTAPAPAPTFEFPWKLFFPPSAAPAPKYRVPVEVVASSNE